jgi:hypothetical protein
LSETDQVSLLDPSLKLVRIRNCLCACMFNHQNRINIQGAGVSYRVGKRRVLINRIKVTV